ncbi:hypothetical protein Mapa_012235 [Marchantia paleacea]|nr:hypothetical protein Mapa_012235 [Marchantia paleacea]
MIGDLCKKTQGKAENVTPSQTVESMEHKFDSDKVKDFETLIALQQGAGKVGVRRSCCSRSFSALLSL